MPTERAKVLRRRRKRRAAMAHLRSRLVAARSSDERRRIAEKMLRRAPQRRAEIEALAAERPRAVAPQARTAEPQPPLRPAEHETRVKQRELELEGAKGRR